MPSVIKTALKLVLGKGSVRSYGQFGEDAIVQKLLKNRKRGFYIDVGAYDPILYSNTYAFYRKGWSGIAIEPNGSLGKLYKVFRPRDVFIKAAIGTGGSQTYYEYADPAYNSFQKRDDVRLVRESEIKFLPLREVVKQHRIEKIDFLNIDVEGLDAQVLESHDWSVKPTVIAIESQENDPGPTFLLNKGYKLVGKAGLTLVFRLA